MKQCIPFLLCTLLATLHAADGNAHLLLNAVIDQNINRVQCLLNRGADVHGIASPLQYTPIHYTTIKSIALELIKRGALEDSTKITGLFLRIAMPQYEPRLVALYANNGVDLLARDKNKCTFLMLLTQYPWQNMLGKAASFLNKLPSETITQLLDAEDAQGNTIFNYISKQSERHTGYLSEFDKLRRFLLQKKFGPNKPCAVCIKLRQHLEIPGPTPSDHTLHIKPLREYTEDGYPSLWDYSLKDGATYEALDDLKIVVSHTITPQLTSATANKEPVC